jgi:hypothetical protein
MKSIVTILAIVIALIGYIPYIRNCILGKTKPHIISWFTWSLVSYLAFGIQLFNEGGVGSFVNLVMGIICTIILILGLKNGTKDIRKIDIVAFVLALIAIALWLIAKQPLLSIILVVFIDLMSFLPTMFKGWRKPHTETAVTFLLSGIKNGMSIYALESFSLVNVLYPAYSALTNIFFVLMLLVRRKSRSVKEEQLKIYSPSEQQRQQLQMVLSLLKRSKENKLEIVVVGGYGLDGLFGHLTRNHDDLDLIVNDKDLKKFREILVELGYNQDPEEGKIDIYRHKDMSESFKVEFNGLNWARDIVKNFDQYLPKIDNAILDGVSFKTLTLSGHKKGKEVQNERAKILGWSSYPEEKELNKSLLFDVLSGE